MSRKRVYVAYTGGTIGMRPTADGYAPAPGYLAEIMAAEERLHAPEMPEFVIHEYEPLLDSADMTPTHWLAIARDIEAQYADFDGFVVLHGTDTMAYTASALPFIMQGLAKPIIVTGAQIPLCEVRSDGRANLITALQLAADFPIAEVCLYFRDVLLRGCRSTKIDADGLQAFGSPNYPPLGTAGVDIEIDWVRVLPPPQPDTRLAVHELVPPRVAALRLFPGISAEILRNVLQAPLQGLVLQSYGRGNGPSQDPELLSALRDATDRGVVVVATSQCVSGTINLRDYVPGSALADAGVISGYDMTDEAALAKLCYLLSCDLAPAELRKRLRTSLRGELTRPRGRRRRRRVAAAVRATGKRPGA